MTNHPSECSRDILVVEDDADIRATLQLALELDGFRTVGAANGKEAIEVLSSMPRPCLILLDLMMPIMNGWEFLNFLRKDENLESIPVVVVTAYSAQAGQIHVQGMIKKPLNLETLSKVAKQWCGKKAA